MSTPVYSTHFLDAIVYSAATAAATSYTCPANKVAVIKSADWFADTACEMWVGVIITGDFIPFFSTKTIPVHDTRHWLGQIVLQAGDVLVCQWVSGTARILADGFVFNQLP